MRLPRFLVGDFNRRSLLAYLSVTFSIYVAQMLTAYVHYPPEENYSIMTHAISYLGDFMVNPGWYYFTSAMITNSLFTLPLALYIFRYLRGVHEKNAKITLFFFVVGIIGGIATGLSPDVQGNQYYIRRHHMAAYLLIFGFILAFFAASGWYQSGPWSFARYYKELPHKTTYYGFIGYLLAYTGLFISQILAKSQGLEWPYPGLYSFSLWEWITLVFTYIVLYSLVFNISIVGGEGGSDHPVADSMGH